MLPESRLSFDVIAQTSRKQYRRHHARNISTKVGLRVFIILIKDNNL